MENLKDKIDDLAENVGGMLDTYYHLTVVNVTDKTVSILSMAFVFLGLLFMAIFILFFVGIGLANYLNTVLENNTEGYFIVAGIYLLLGIIVMLIRKTVFFPFIRNLLIKKVYE